MIQKFAGSEGHCMSSQLPEAAGWLAERFLLSPDFQEIRRIPAPSPMHHMLCILPAREVLAKQVSCPCFARTMLCTPQEGRNRRGGVGQSPPLFLVPLSMCSPIMFDYLLLAFISASPWLARVCSSSLSLCCVLPGASCFAVINCTETCFPGCLHL